MVIRKELRRKESSAGMKIKPKSLVKWEIELFRQECNFTPDQAMFFDLRNEGDGMSLEEIAENMGYSMSKITDLSEEVTSKMAKVMPIKESYLKKYCEEYGQ